MKPRWVVSFVTLMLVSAGWVKASPANDPRIIIGGGTGSVAVMGTFTIVSPTGTSPTNLAGGSPCFVNGITDDPCVLLNGASFDFFSLTFSLVGNSNTSGGFSCDPGVLFHACSFNTTDTEVTFTGGPGIAPGGDFQITFEGWSPNTTFDGTATAPEPGTLALFGAGLLGLGRVLRRRARRPSSGLQG